MKEWFGGWGAMFTGRLTSGDGRSVLRPKNKEEKKLSRQKIQEIEDPGERAWAFWRMRGASTAGTQGARHRLVLEALDSHGELGEGQTGKEFNTYLFKPFLFWRLILESFCSWILTKDSFAFLLVARLCPTFATPCTVAHQAPLSIGFPRQEYWSGLAFSSPRDLPYPRIKPKSPALASEFFFFFFFSFIFISWRLITLQYYSGFCHTLTWISHGFTCVPHPYPPSHARGWCTGKTQRQVSSLPLSYQRSFTLDKDNGGGDWSEWTWNQFWRQVAELNEKHVRTWIKNNCGIFVR